LRHKRVQTFAQQNYPHRIRTSRQRKTWHIKKRRLMAPFLRFAEAGGSFYERRRKPTSPANAEANNHTAAGTGTCSANTIMLSIFP